MAKVVIAGQAVVVKSALSLEDLKLVEKCRPKSLILMGGDDGKEPVFRVATTDGEGSINAIGASFNSASNDGEGKACLTLAASGIADIKTWVTENLTAALISLNKLEEKLPAVLTEIAAEKAAVMENIEVLA